MLNHLNLQTVELGKPFVFLKRGRVIERKPQYQRVRDCGESECQQDESSGKTITRWTESYDLLERGQTSTWSSTRKKRKEESF